MEERKIILVMEGMGLTGGGGAAAAAPESGGGGAAAARASATNASPAPAAAAIDEAMSLYCPCFSAGHTLCAASVGEFRHLPGFSVTIRARHKGWVGSLCGGGLVIRRSAG